MDRERTSARYNDINDGLRRLPGVSVKDLKSRVSYWRADRTRFCNIEWDGDDLIIVFTDMAYAQQGHLLQGSEPDYKGRLKLRLTNNARLEKALDLARVHCR